MSLKKTALSLIAAGAIAVLSLAATPASAAPSACAANFAGGEAPEITNKKMSVRTRELCFSSFAVMHSGLTRTPLWSAEHLTRDSLDSAKGIKRVDSFHPEERLPASDRAELRDYSRSGYDRGHMTPRSDPSSPEGQAETFSLANMIPQNPNNNQNLWNGIESSVRTLAKRSGELYVITGPLFQGANLKQLNGRVVVPTQIYKVVYDPKKRQSAAYLVENEATSDYKVVSIAELEQIAGINFFPGMPESAKRSAMSLPKPTPHGNAGERNNGGERRHSERRYRSSEDSLRTLRALTKILM